MRYRLVAYDEADNIVEDRICDNEAVLGGVIAHTIGDCDTFTVKDADDLNGEVIMKYSAGGF